MSCRRAPTLALLLLGLAPLASAQAPAKGEPEQAPAPPSLIRSPEDGWLDASAFIDQAHGFLPVAIPITEPAVGYGAALALAFIDKPKGEFKSGLGRPNITLVGAMATENGSKGVMLGDLRHWAGDRVQTLVGMVKASVNLDFYGLDADSRLSTHPLRYTLKPEGGLLRTRFRLGETRAWLGLEYTYASTEVSFKAPDQWPTGPGFEKRSRIGGLSPSLSLDTRDNMFTPTSGTLAELEFSVYRKVLGGDGDFQRNAGRVMQYLPLHRDFTLGLRGDAILSSGEVPFYLRPFIILRGAPAMRYQGEKVAFAESELRWQFWRRFSVIGFVGTGTAWKEKADNLPNQNDRESILTGGTGFRYELARKHALHAGLDVAFGPDGYAVYVQFGSAWMRP